MRLRRVGLGGLITALATCSLLACLGVSAASADTLGPAFSAHSPAHGSTLASRTYVDGEDYYGHIPVSVTVSDPDGVPDQVAAGTVVSGGYTFGFYPTAMRVDANTVVLTEQQGYVADGDYTVTANARDALGNLASMTWSFGLDEGYPYVTGWSPAGDSWKPSDPIIVDVTDAGSGVEPASLIMTVDGALVTASTSVAGGTLHAVYVPTASLALGAHVVSVSCVDRAGHPASKTWTFTTVAANTAPQVTYDNTSSGRQVMSGGYWYLDENGDPVSWAPASVTQVFQMIDADIIDRASLVWQMSDSTNTTTRTVTPFASWSSGDQKLTISASVNGVTDGQVFRTHLVAADILGEVRTYDRTFMAVKDFPYATDQQPAPGVHQSLTRPTVQVTFRDSSAGIDSGSIVMTVDGQPLSISTTPVTDGYTISGVPDADLASGSHTAVVTCEDGVGAPATSTWSFYVDTPTAPAFSETYPGNLGVANRGWGAYVSSRVFDADGIMPGTQELSLTFPSGETVEVDANMYWDDEWLGTPWEQNYARLSYALPLDTPEDGPINAVLSVADTTGMRGSTSWTFSYVRDAPKYFSKTPAAASVTTSTSPVLSVRVTDSSGIDPDSIRGYLDGVEVPCMLTPVTGGYEVRHTGSAFAPRTTHEFRVYAEDTAGWSTPLPGWGEDAPAWSFYVAVEPQPSAHAPAPASTTSTDTPTLSVAFDELDGLSSAGAGFTIDGMPVSPQVLLSDSNRHAVLTYTARFSPGTHTVVARISSTKGVVGTTTWSFIVPGLPEMEYLEGSYDACVACHEYPTNTERRVSFGAYWRDFPTSRTFDDIHNATLQDNYHNNNCQKCHAKMTVVGKTNCDICHIIVNDYFATAADGYRLRDGEHGNTFGYTYLDRSTPGKYTISSPRTWDDCLYCHQVQTAFAPMVANHDMTQGHTLQLDEACAECHDKVLTREHAKLTALDSGGAALVCTSCHGSEDTTVAAVALGTPTYRFASESDGFEPTVVDPAWMDHSREFAVPGGQITAFALSMRASHVTSYTVEAWYGGQWVHVSTTKIAAGYTLNLGNYANGNNYLAKTTTVNVTLPAPTDKVRLGLRTFSGWGYSIRKNVEARITNVATTRAPVRCSSCHADGHPHPAGEVSALANGQRACSVCHSSDIIAEHSKVTSAGNDDTCETCHAPGGARDAMNGASWDGQCDNAACHGQGTGREVHANYCLACHDESQPAFSVAKTSFPDAAPVSRDTACKACHAPGLVGTHPYHQAGANCGAACHPGWGNSLVSATPVYTDPASGASFGSPDSKNTPPAVLHTIHGAARWPAGADVARSACSSCHAVAACNACHTGVLPSTHGEHSSTDQTANAAWAGTMAHGVSGGDQTQRTAFPDANQCGSAQCHDLAGAAARAPSAVEDYNHALGANPDDPNVANAAVALTGTWRYRASNRYTGGRMSYANLAGNRLDATFAGERIELVSDKDPYRGTAQVFIDGALAGTFDAYAPTTKFQVVVFAADLESGAHTISVRPTGVKSGSARGTFVVVDAFWVYADLTGSIVPACTSCHDDRAATHW